MLVIRLARTGKKHQAYFRVVVADSKRAVTSKFIEILGNYDPHAKKLVINKEQVEKYLKNGAQPSNSVAKLLVAEKIELPKWVKVATKNKPPKKEPVVKEVKEAAPTAEASTESPESAEATEEVAVESNEEAASEITEEPKAEEAPAEESKTEEAEEPKEAKEEAEASTEE